MRIIKAGRRKEWWEGKVGTCKHCSTEVQLEVDDRVAEQSDRDGQLASVPCPNPSCKDQIWVYPKSPDATEHDCE
jgi:hypothetical protein